MIDQIQTAAAVFSIIIAVASVTSTWFLYRKSKQALEEVRSLTAKGRDLPATPNIADPEVDELPDTGEPDQNA